MDEFSFAIESWGSTESTFLNESLFVNDSLLVNETFVNGTGNATNPQEEIFQAAAVIVPVLFGLIAITGLFGNSLVILVVLPNPQMRSTTNLLIVNLAIADLLFIICCIPFTAADYMFAIWPFGHVWCQIVQYLIVVTAHVSIYTLVLMSIDRYLAVVHPIKSRSIRTEYHMKIIILIMWITIIMCSLPVPFLHGINRFPYYGADYHKCQLVIQEASSFMAYQITFFLTSYILPLITISSLYLRMIIRLWRTVVGSKMSAESHRGRKRITRLVVVVVFAFASLWFPIQIVLLLKGLDCYNTNIDGLLILQIFSHIAAYTSSCINPLLYAFLSENFRKAFRKAIHCLQKSNNNISYSAQLQTRTSQVQNSTAI